jgi:hypothetical protein
VALFDITIITVIIKVLTSVMVALPVIFSMYWIFRLSTQAVNNAAVVERIQNLLLLFHPDYYGPESPYPQAWQGNLTKNLRKRRTPVYYAATMATMTACVLISIWVVL